LNPKLKLYIVVIYNSPLLTLNAESSYLRKLGSKTTTSDGFIPKKTPHNDLKKKKVNKKKH